MRFRRKGLSGNHRMGEKAIQGCRRGEAGDFPLMPLALARPGGKYIIREMRAGKMARAKLTALGLRAGDQVEIISGDGQGRLVVAHHFTRLAIGRGLAGKIMVSPYQGNEQLNQK